MCWFFFGPPFKKMAEKPVAPPSVAAAPWILPEKLGTKERQKVIGDQPKDPRREKMSQHAIGMTILLRKCGHKGTVLLLRSPLAEASKKHLLPKSSHSIKQINYESVNWQTILVI